MTLDSTTIEPIMVKNIFTPTTGGTVSLSQARRQYAILAPSGTLLTLTVNLPSSPNDGDVVKIGTSQVITTLTLGTGSNSIGSALATMALGGFGEWIYDLSTTKWYRFG